MSVIQPQLPLPVRALNGVFAALGPIGTKIIKLDAAALMKKASRDTALTDFGSDYFRAPLDRLCDSLETDARLTALGRIMARQQISRLLRHRLQFVDIFKRHPEIADQEVAAPIFILGMPRTGTTSLHELMALDPQFRVPLSWEVAYPFPPPRTETYLSDPRIAQVDKELAGVDQLLPAFKDMHPMGATLPQECVALFSHDFVSMIFDVQFRLKEYQAWLIQEDMTEVFRNHRRWLQLLQWKCPGETWVLKSPQYLWNVEDMLREYPDAQVLQTHRDPVAVSMSIGSLTSALRGLGSNDVDQKEVASDYADLLQFGMEKTQAARTSGLLSADRVIDVQFASFRNDGMGVVREVYEFFGKALSEDTATRMTQFLAAGNDNKRHGKHRYTLEESGFDLEAERARFREYTTLHEVPEETFSG
jgi:hypothetical protein